MIISPSSLRWPFVEPDQAPYKQHNAHYETNHTPVDQIAEDNNHSELQDEVTLWDRIHQGPRVVGPQAKHPTDEHDYRVSQKECVVEILDFLIGPLQHLFNEVGFGSIVRQ